MSYVSLAEFDLDGGGSVVVEIADDAGYDTRVGRTDDLTTRVGVTFEKAIGRVRDAAAAALGQFQQMARRPDAVEIKFGIKLNAEVGAVIARTGVEGQLEVKLTWHAPAESPDAE